MEISVVAVQQVGEAKKGSGGTGRKTDAKNIGHKLKH
jgi:hypothetical protein